MKSLLSRLSAVTILVAGAATGQNALPSVLTYHNDGSRTGANLQETVLNTSNVNAASFGKVFSRPVDDQIYSQLLYMPGVSIPGRGTHNVIFVATVNDTVYAFDADYPALDLPLWKVSFLSSGVRAVTHADLSAVGACGGSYNDFTGNIGIVGTPVIDPTPFPGASSGDQGTIYLVARTWQSRKFTQSLHALNVRTGEERPGSPVVIQYSGFIGGNSLAFDPVIQNQRPGLALVNGRVYIGWASHCDLGSYHGWLMGYDAHTLQRASVYCTTPGGLRGGIWMGGSPPSFDEQGNLYLSTGNGTIGTVSPFTGVVLDATNPLNRGESFLKLTPSGNTMTLASFFTPYNYTQLEGGDIDLGSAGLLLFPGANGKNLAIGAGKQGRLYVVDRDHMGGVQEGSDSQIVQSIDVNLNNKVMGGPVYWQGPDAVKKFYIWAANSPLKAYSYNGPAFNTTPQTSTMTVSNPGAMLSLSANGSTAGTGIVWAMCPTADANHDNVGGVLRALNAEDISQELWNSSANSGRDGMSSYAKFNQPTIVNGSVYVPTFSNQFLVYGLLSNAPSPVAPLQLTAAAVSKIQVHLEWSLPDGASQTGFVVERSTNGTTFDQVMNLPAEARSYDDMTVARFTHYVYRIKAFNLAGSSVSPVAEASTTIGAPEAVIAVSGSGHDIPADSTFTNVDDGTAFGQLLLGSGASITRTFTIRNGGNAALNLNGSPVVEISGPGAGDFAVTQGPTGSIVPSGSSDFAIAFTPHVAGARSATVTILNDDPYGSPFRFAITGLGAQQDLVARWLFNEDAGALSTADATGRGHTGTVQAGKSPDFGRYGVFDAAVGYASSFGPGFQPSIAVANAPDLNPVDGLTLSCWISWQGSRSGYQQPLVMKGGAENQYRLYIDEFGLKADFGNVAALVAPVPPRNGWNHIAATYDGAAARLYLNGKLLVSTNTSGPLVVTSDPLFIGGRANSNDHFSGTIDDLRIFGRGLAAGEIQKLAAQRTAVSISALVPEATKGVSGGQFQFLSQWYVENLNVNFEIVSGPGQGIYRTDYGMSVIPPFAAFPQGLAALPVNVTPLTFNTVTGPVDVTLRVLEGDNYQPSKNDTATVHILDSPFNQWRTAQFGGIEQANLPLAAEDASPAHDGVANLLKYALGLPPLTPVQPQFRMEWQEWDDGQHMVLVYTTPSPKPADLEYVPEWQAGSLSGDWQPAYVLSEEDQGDGTMTVRALCSIPAGDEPQIFMRLRVNRP